MRGASGASGCTSSPPRAGLQIALAVAGAKANGREVRSAMLDPDHLARPGQVIVSDKGYRSAGLEEHLNDLSMTHIRPAAKNEKTRPGKQFLRPLRQSIEAAFGTLKSQLSLERHHNRTRTGVFTRPTSASIG